MLGLGFGHLSQSNASSKGGKSHAQKYWVLSKVLENEQSSGRAQETINSVWRAQSGGTFKNTGKMVLINLLME